MANQAPDARELKSWEDAFQYPLPVIRKLEQQLRTGVNDNREKVRALVGSGYRDLLGTADRISDMNKEMRILEHAISDVGLKCNSRHIARMTLQHEKLTAHRIEEHAARRRPASEIALLQAAIAACRPLLKKDADLLLAARLLLLARLLQNNAVKSAEGARAQSLKLGSLRNRLLALIEDCLGDVRLSRGQTLDLLLAYSLVNTSSLADASRYLLRVRQQSIAELCTDPGRKNLLKAIDLLAATLEQANSLFLRRMSEAMERLTGPHLLHDEGLRAALEFDLGIYEKWISNDIRSFVPWLRANDLSKEALAQSLKQWASTASSTITTGLNALLTKHNSPPRIASLREKSIRHLLSNVTTSEEFDKDALLMTMRRMFQDRLFNVISGRAQVISTHIDEVLRTEITSEHRVPSIWSQDAEKLEIRRGGTALRHTIAMRAEGKDKTLQRLDTVMTGWLAGLEDARRVAKEMRQTRWADEMDNDDSLDGLASGEQYQQLLASDDPSGLLDHILAETDKALHSSIEAIGKAAQNLSPKSAPQARMLFLLRVLRVIPIAQGDQPGNASLAPKVDAILRTLHSALAAEVVESMPQDLEKAIFSVSPATSLWQGSQGQTPLPVLPSPGTFSLLRALSSAMNDAGLDVWTAAAVEALRIKAIKVVGQAADQFLETSSKSPTLPSPETSKSDSDAETPKVNGEESKTDGAAVEEADTAEVEHGSSTEADAKDPSPATEPEPAATVSLPARYTQALFDSVYLGQVLSPGSDSSSLSSAVTRLRTASALSDADFDRISNNAAAYHRRSYLLFGALM